jgi:RHS repeat-associated protein
VPVLTRSIRKAKARAHESQEIASLKSASVDGTIATFTYDGDGKRASKTVGANPATAYVYDANRSLPVVLDDGSRKYVWGAAGTAYLVDKGSGAVQVYHADGLGSVRGLTDAGGALGQTYMSDAFAVPNAQYTQGTAVHQPFRYTDEQADGESGETGLVYLRARMYDPQAGRFMSRDPRDASDCTPESPNSLHRYAYAQNNSMNRIDPSGLVDVPVDPDCRLGQKGWASFWVGSGRGHRIWDWHDDKGTKHRLVHQLPVCTKREAPCLMISDFNSAHFSDRAADRVLLQWRGASASHQAAGCTNRPKY